VRTTPRDNKPHICLAKCSRGQCWTARAPRQLYWHDNPKAWVTICSFINRHLVSKHP
jgi:hypothetical protein